jgi:hypothetical protein
MEGNILDDFWLILHGQHPPGKKAGRSVDQTIKLCILSESTFTGKGRPGDVGAWGSAVADDTRGQRTRDVGRAFIYFTPQERYLMTIEKKFLQARKRG